MQSLLVPLWHLLFYYLAIIEDDLTNYKVVIDEYKNEGSGVTAITDLVLLIFSISVFVV